MIYSNELYKILNSSKNMKGAVLTDIAILLIFWTAIVTICWYGFKFISDVVSKYRIWDYIQEVLIKLAWRIGWDAVFFLSIAFIGCLIIYFLRWLLSWLSNAWDPVDD